MQHFPSQTKKGGFCISHRDHWLQKLPSYIVAQLLLSCLLLNLPPYLIPSCTSFSISGKESKPPPDKYQ